MARKGGSFYFSCTVTVERVRQGISYKLVEKDLGMKNYVVSLPPSRSGALNQLTSHRHYLQ